jgi:hypothetical protein
MKLQWPFLKKAKSSSRPRHYLANNLTIDNFFMTLKNRSIRYCVLRWYENLPHIAESEDIDLLIHDDDLGCISDLIQKSRGSQAIDLYSVSGLPGSAFRKLPYYQHNLAEQILANTRLLRGTYLVPCAEHAFLSLAYHVLYHKGFGSGLRSIHQPSATPKPPDHDYASTLRAAAQAASIAIDWPESPTLEDIEATLSAHGWRPSIDTLEKLAVKNEWIRAQHFSKEMVEDHPVRGLCVFILREKGLPHLEKTVSILRGSGFHLLEQFSIPERQQRLISKNIRGGNWSAGPWPCTGGAPAHALICHDVFPLDVPEAIKQQHPGLDNKRIEAVKRTIRTVTNMALDVEQRCNVIHSSDNGRQALEYARLLSGAQAEQLTAAVATLNSRHSAPYPILELFPGNRRRALVGRVWINGNDAVIKLFRTGQEGFLKREVSARQAALRLPVVAELIETGPNYIIMPYFFDDAKLRFWKTMPCGHLILRPYVVKTVIDTICFYRSQEIECIDLKPDSFRIDPFKGIKLVDCEFFQKPMTALYHEPGDLLSGAMAFDRYSQEAVKDQPRGKSFQNPYQKHWERSIGVPRRLLREGLSEGQIRARQLLFSGITSWQRRIRKIQAAGCQ